MKLFLDKPSNNYYSGYGNYKTVDSLQVCISQAAPGRYFKDISYEECVKYDVTGWYMGCFFIKFSPKLKFDDVQKFIDRNHFEICADAPDYTSALKILQNHLQKIVDKEFKPESTKVIIELHPQEKSLANLERYYREKYPHLHPISVEHKVEHKDDRSNSPKMKEDISIFGLFSDTNTLQAPEQKSDKSNIKSDEPKKTLIRMRDKS